MHSHAPGPILVSDTIRVLPSPHVVAAHGGTSGGAERSWQRAPSRDDGLASSPQEERTERPGGQEGQPVMAEWKAEEGEDSGGLSQTMASSAGQQSCTWLPS